MMVGSGNLVHSRGAMNPSPDNQGFDWAQRFDDRASALLLDDPADAVRLKDDADFSAAVPTPDHFIPLLYFAGLASGDDSVEVLTDGLAYGAISMTSYTV